MSLFTLLKISRTRYMLGKKHVRPGTTGAVKVVEESRYWYAYRRDGKKQVKIRLFTDKAASRSEVARLNNALERGEAGMTDPHKEHLERPAAEHLKEFLPVMRESGKSEKDKGRKEAILQAFVATLAKQPTPPTPIDVPADSNVEMTWQTFGGEAHELFLALLKERCVRDGLSCGEEVVARQFRLHLHRGISYLATPGAVKSVGDLIRLAVVDQVPSPEVREAD